MLLKAVAFMEFPINKGRLIGHGQRSKPDKADYVLQYKNRNLAVIEAKARDKYYTEGVGQAKDYAGKLQVRFTYSTNGLQIYRIDMQEGQGRWCNFLSYSRRIVGNDFWRTKPTPTPFSRLARQNYFLFRLKTVAEHGNQDTIRKTLLPKF